MNILILCTGNSCRSQMAHGFLQSLNPNLTVRSAGTNPSHQVHPIAIKVMKEIGIDISTHIPQHIDKYLNESWDFVITVCGDANGSCPTFMGNVKNRLHIGFDDPAKFIGSDEQILNEFRRIRDLIRKEFTNLYNQKIKSYAKQ
ncbi:MAG: arsenate reductase ArsC [Bacteroidales bacterium]|nr:arsenate reductase ArsC [Bacteroidales bacterium]